jgi:hypothetical protein
LWNEGVTNGGTPVIDYKITYGEATGSYNQEIAGITQTTYTVIGLTTETVYKFKV